MNLVVGSVVGRRLFVSAVTAALAGTPAFPAFAAVQGTITGDTSRKCQTSSTPAATVVTCLGYGKDKDGRLKGCGADEACIAPAAVNNPSKFSPPWAPIANSREAQDPQRAWRALVNAVEEQNGIQIVERSDDSYYLRATAPSAVPTDGIDDIEFRLLPEVGAPRALFRTASRQAVFVYPLQQPIPNQASHAERLKAIRVRLGWEEAGLPVDGKALDAAMMERYKVPTAKRIFGLELGGMSVPEDYDD